MSRTIARMFTAVIVKPSLVPDTRHVVAKKRGPYLSSAIRARSASPGYTTPQGMEASSMTGM